MMPSEMRQTREFEYENARLQRAATHWPDGSAKNLVWREAMNVTVNNRSIADVRFQGVTIRPVVGAYELLFSLSISIYPMSDVARRASIMGGRVHVTGYGGRRQEIGFARPEQPFVLSQNKFSYSRTAVLVLPIQPGQVSAIEDLRDAADLNFELEIAGTGHEQGQEHEIFDTWRSHVSQSDWIKTLKDAGARNVLLLEVPLAIGASSEKWTAIEDNLRRAEKHFMMGDYHSCVASCRTIVQDLGSIRFNDKNWSTSVLKRLSNDRTGMGKEERESGIWGALRHYTHQAHHGDSEGGELYYTRSEAELVFTLTASFIARSVNAGSP